VTGQQTTMPKDMRGHSTLFIRKVEESDQKPIVLQLADTCIERSIAIAEVAGLFGVSRATVYNWMTGRTVPRACHIAAMPKIIARLNKRK
jgi:hypothetical protein